MAFSWIVTPEVLQTEYRRALQLQLSRNYRIVPDRRKGQSAFGSSLPQGERRDPTQFHHDCANKNFQPVNCITSGGMALRYFVSGELDGRGYSRLSAGRTRSAAAFPARQRRVRLSAKPPNEGVPCPRSSISRRPPASSPR